MALAYDPGFGSIEKGGKHDSFVCLFQSVVNPFVQKIWYKSFGVLPASSGQ